MKPFTDVLRDIRKGRAVDDATMKLQQVVQAVLETGKPGAVTVQLTVKPQKNDSEQVVIVTQVKAKTPEHDLPDAIFFVDGEDFSLHRTDPNQREMFAEASDDRRARPAVV